MPVDLVWVLPFVLAGAALYTSVGHGGATIYLAVLTLAGFAVAGLVTTVLVLNILAAGIAFLMFRGAGHLRGRLLLPFASTSVPFAYLGGRLTFGAAAQEAILGVALLLAALRFLFFASLPRVPHPPARRVFWAVAFPLGAVLGFLAGVTGIGGGIFLSPLLVFLGWADVREAGTVASAFIVLNSLAGLAAKWVGSAPVPSLLGPLGAVVVVGAVAGSYFGARRLPPRALQVLLGVVLAVAGAKQFLA